MYFFLWYWNSVFLISIISHESELVSLFSLREHHNTNLILKDVHSKGNKLTGICGFHPLMPPGAHWAKKVKDIISNPLRILRGELPNLWPKYKGMELESCNPLWTSWGLSHASCTFNLSCVSPGENMKCDLCLLHGQRVELFLIIYLFIWLTRSLNCGMQTLRISLPNQGLNLGPLHWGWGISATSAPGEILRVEFQLGSMGPHAWWASSAALCHAAISTPPPSWQEGPSHSFRWQRSASPLHTHTLLAVWCCGVPSPPWR